MTRTGRRDAAVLTDALDANRDSERRRAARALLRSPLLAGSDPAFPLVRKHAGWLREWFAKEAGWHLRIDPEVARLRKTSPDNTDDTRPAVSGKGQPLRRRRYVLLCLALAALERADAQTTLGRLAEAVLAGAADPSLVAAGVTIDLESRDDRTDLVAAVRLLLDLGVLRRVAGDEASYIAGPGDALYDVDRRVLAGLLVTRRGPSAVPDPGDLDARIAAVTAELIPEGDARVRATRHQVTRRLLDDPVVYYADLPPHELTYLTGQRGAVLRRITEATGLLPEVRAEGIALVDSPGADPVTDVKMPEEGTDGHVTLLLAEHLARRAGTGGQNTGDQNTGGPDTGGNGAEIALSDLHGHVRTLAAQHRSVWRRGAAEPGAEVALTRLALDRLVALRLARRTAAGVVGLPALARFALAPFDADPGKEELA